MKKYDVIVIGLGPAGMAAANMAIEMGLKVLAIESRNIERDCYENIGVTSQTLLAICDQNPMLIESLAHINADIYHIRENKIASLFEKADVLLGQGFASFVFNNSSAYYRSYVHLPCKALCKREECKW